MKKCDMPKAKKRHYDDTEKKNQMKTLNLLLTLLKFKSLSISCIVEVEEEEKSLKAKTAKMKTKLLLISHKSQLSDGLFTTSIQPSHFSLYLYHFFSHIVFGELLLLLIQLLFYEHGVDEIPPEVIAAFSSRDITHVDFSSNSLVSLDGKRAEKTSPIT